MSNFTGRLLRVIRRLRPEIRRHRRFLLIGTAGSLVVVACRLAYAWPLKGVLNASSGTPINGLIALFLVIAATQGVGEYFQRVWFARFAIATSRDVRGRALQTLARDGARGKKARGEAVSRVVGDTSRFKSGIKGVLIRYTQNGVFFVGVFVALLIIDPKLGLVFLLGGVAIVLAAGIGAARVNRIAGRLRKKEGRLVAQMHAELASDAPSAAGMIAPATDSRVEAKTAHAQQQAVLAVHVLLGLTVCAVIALGVHDVRTGVIPSSDLVLVLFFLVQVHNPVLKLGRSTMRLGRALASAERLLSLADRPAHPAAQLQLDLDLDPIPEPEPEPDVVELPEPRGVPSSLFAHWADSR